MIQLALKILWRQCSEFACANIMSSTSVGSRPRRAEALEQVVDLVGRQRQPELGGSPRSSAGAPRGQRDATQAAAAARARTGARPAAPSSSAISVMRSSSAGASAQQALTAQRRPRRCTRYSMPRSMRRTALKAAHVRDVGRLARPRRDGARRAARPGCASPAAAAAACEARPVGQQLLEHAALRGAQRRAPDRRSARSARPAPAPPARAPAAAARSLAMRKADSAGGPGISSMLSEPSLLLARRSRSTSASETA